ncbi:MAG: Gfo/Idh/MocA family oxidoreductase [Bacteroidota bacterium]
MKQLKPIAKRLHAGTNSNRPNFSKHTGNGLIPAAVIDDLTPEGEDKSILITESEMDDIVPIKLKPVKASGEQTTGDIPGPLRPGKRIGYAIVGLGNLALNQVLPGMAKCKYSKPVALVSGDTGKAQKVAHQYGIAQKNIYNYQNYDSIKNNPEIDAVYIILPNSMHEEFTVRAAKAGKHVLCEKPMSTSPAAAQRMIDACKNAGKKLMIAYRIQYETNSRQIMKWTRNQHFGKVRVINSFNGQNTGDPTQWRMKKELSGGGSLPDIGLYNLNTARFLLGEEPEIIIASIYTTPGDVRFKEVEESVMFQLFFPSGAIASNTCSYSVHENRYYRCHADNGGVMGVNNAFAYTGLQMEISKSEGNIEYKSNPSIAPEQDQFATEIDHMSRAILFNKTPYTPGEEGLQDQKIMEAIYESARTGRAVTMPKINKLDAFRGDPPEGS